LQHTHRLVVGESECAFAYEALASSGQRSTGTLTAGSDREVMAMLDARGLFPLHISPAKAAGGSFSFAALTCPRSLVQAL
jgi:type II secretory pathway component PulF